jgi:hypothetical protein
MGSVTALRACTEDDLLALAWLPDAVGRAVFTRLHDGAGAAAGRAAPSRASMEAP